MKRLYLIILLVLLSFIQTSCFFDIFSNDSNEIGVADNIFLINAEGYNGNYVLIEKKENGYYDILIEEKIVELKKDQSTIYVKTNVSNNTYFYIVKKNTNLKYVVNKINEKEYILDIKKSKKCTDIRIPQLLEE